VEERPINRATIEAISTQLVALKTQVIDASYGFGFDPLSGTVILRSEAPESAFAKIEDAFPGKISYLSAKWTQTSWNNDGQPHWGGAWIQSAAELCTSAFPMADAAGRRYMMTAGHCFPNGTATNMGTAERGPYWPANDSALVSRHLVAGHIYDTPTTQRNISDGTNPSIGVSYCTTGRTSGFVCDWTVRQLEYTICFLDRPGCTLHMVGFDRPNGSTVQPGDSGGPLYRKYSDFTDGVRGIISGYVWDWGTFRYMSYAQSYQSVANTWGMHVITYP
jgi:hypothetical protein